MHVHDSTSTHPHVQEAINEALIKCLEECHACEKACIACADACLGEPMVQDLVQCIRVNLDCADVCHTTGAVAARRSGSNEGVMRRMLAVCEMACRICGDECMRHAAHHAHCRLCAEACRRCEHACTAALRSMA